MASFVCLIGPVSATANSVTTPPPPKTGPPSLAIKYYMNMNYTAIVGNYTIDGAVASWRTWRWDPRQLNFTNVFNSSLYRILPLKSMNLTTIIPVITDLFYLQNQVIEYAVGSVMTALIGTWTTADEALYNYMGLLDATLTNVTKAWSQRQLSYAAAHVFSLDNYTPVNMSAVKASDMLVAQSIAVDPNITALLADDFSTGAVAATVVGLAAVRLDKTTTWNTYLGVIGTALQPIAKNQGYSSGFGYSSYLTSALQGISQWWPGKKGDFDGLWANFSQLSLSIDWQVQLGFGVNWIDPTIKLPLNFTKFEFYSRPPVVVPLVTVIDIEFYVTGNMSADDVLARIRWLNSQLILIFRIGTYVVQLWLIEDNIVPDHTQIPQPACIASLLNFLVAFGTLGYFMRKLHKSERYQQVPILDEDEEEIS